MSWPELRQADDVLRDTQTYFANQKNEVGFNILRRSGSQCEWRYPDRPLSPEFLRIGSSELDDTSAEGLSYHGVLDELKKVLRLETDGGWIKGKSAHFPIIIFITNGCAVGNCAQELEEMNRSNQWFHRAFKIVLTIGDRADYAALERIVENPEAIISADDTDVLKDLKVFAAEAEEVKKTAAVFFVLDVSSSMDGSRIRRLNRSMHEILQTMNRIAQTADVTIEAVILPFSSNTGDSGARVLTFGHSSDAVKNESFLEQADNYELLAGGMTNMGEALKGLDDALSKYTRHGETEFSSIIFMTDGKSSDSWYSQRAELRKNPRFTGSVKFGIALGKDADLQMLRDITGSDKTVVQTDELGTFHNMLWNFAVEETFYMLFEKTAPRVFCRQEQQPDITPLRYKRDSMAVAEQMTWPVYLMVDASEHAGDEKRLNRAYHKIIKILQEDFGPKAKVGISVIRLGEPRRPVTGYDFMDVREFEPEELHISGECRLGPAAHELLKVLQQCRWKNEENHWVACRPLIIYLASGRFARNWKAGLQLLERSEIYQKAEKRFVAVGQNPDFDVLQQLTARKDGDALDVWFPTERDLQKCMETEPFPQPETDVYYADEQISETSDAESPKSARTKKPRTKSSRKSSGKRTPKSSGRKTAGKIKEPVQAEPEFQTEEGGTVN